MNFFSWVAVLAVVLVGIIQGFTAFQLARLRRAGLYPQPGQATMDDVTRLQQAGMSVWAIRCYREIHGGSLRQAKEAVAGLPFQGRSAEQTNPISPVFVTPAFLNTTKSHGRLLEAMDRLPTLSDAELATLPHLAGLSSWECVLEEVLDTDHDPPYYDRFVHELFCRGYRREDILEMRMIAWETAGWLNYEMMLWDWCSLTEEDMTLGLKHRFESGNISQQRFEQLTAAIEQYRNPPLIDAK